MMTATRTDGRQLPAVRPEDGLPLYLSMLFGTEPAGAFAEVRWKAGAGMGQRFFPVGALDALAAFVTARGAESDTYVGVAPRSRQEGRNAAVERAHVLWVDADTPDAAEALAAFTPAPSMVVRSGRGRHAYWSLLEPVRGRELRAANRRLAAALGADQAATDAARILRPPGTLSFKHGEPRPVTVESVLVECYHAEDVLASAPPTEPTPARAVPIRQPASRTGGALLDIPADVWLPALTGRTVGRDGKATCPFHGGGQERTPSFQVYGSGWACFGCEAPPGRDAAGGTVIDFAARLYGIEPRGAGYHELRRRVARVLLGTEAAA